MPLTPDDEINAVIAFAWDEPRVFDENAYTSARRMAEALEQVKDAPRGGDRRQERCLVHTLERRRRECDQPIVRMNQIKTAIAIIKFLRLLIEIQIGLLRIGKKICHAHDRRIDSIKGIAH